MFDKEIPVLLVDDDPDVLTISKMAMRQFEVFGLPVTTYTATSKADAIELLESRFARRTQVGSRLTVAFVDVVMETDHAGLELCRYIRERLGNRSVQLYVRTGQPGIAPERVVIDDYDVDGYFTKMETTATKLYSLVKIGTRQAYLTGLSQTLSQVLEALIEVGDSQARMREALLRSWSSWDGDVRVALVTPEGSIAHGLDAQALPELRDRLQAGPVRPIGDDGDTYLIDGERCLIHVAGGPTTTEVVEVIVGHAPVPAVLVPLLHTFTRSFASLWRRASA